MSTPGIGTGQLVLSGTSLNPLQSVNSVSSLGQPTSTSSVQDPDGDHDGGTGSAASTHISKQAQLYNQIQQLEKTDPAKAQQVLSDIASKLTAAAQSATGNDKTFLTNLADKFTKAANGDLSALAPPPHTGSGAAGAYAQNQPTGSAPLAGAAPSGGRHHHGGGPSASTQQTLSSVFAELSSALGGISSTTTTNQIGASLS